MNSSMRFRPGRTRLSSPPPLNLSRERYPFKDDVFATAWNSEGAALSRALRAPDPAGMKTAAIEFFRIAIEDGERRSGRRAGPLRAALGMA